MIQPTIHHVLREIPPERLSGCIAFYEQLGFVRVRPPESLADRYVWLELGPTQLHLAPRSGATTATGHIAVVLPAYDTTLTELRAAGHSVEPREDHWGSPRAYVHDPAGNLVEVMARPPESPRL